MGSFEIYFCDLNKETQEAYLEFAGLRSAREANLDVFPLVMMEAPEPKLNISPRLAGTTAKKAKARHDRDAR